MSNIGHTLVDILSQLDEEGDKGEPASTVSFKIKSNDFRRYLKKLGSKLDDMSSSLEFLASEVERTFINHFFSETGPDENGSDLESWSPYYRGNDPDSYKAWKMNSDGNKGGDKLLHFSGTLKESLYPGGTGHIRDVSNRKLEVGTEIGYYIFAHTGFTGRKGSPGPEDTKRTIIGLTDEEEDEIIEAFKENFFGDLD